MANPDDDQALLRIINYPARGIGNTTIQKITVAAENGETSMWQVIRRPGFYGLNVNKGTLTKLDGFATLIEGFLAKTKNTDIYALGKDIVKISGISADLYSSRDAEHISRQENLEELLGHAGLR